jgi:hypothetical protein
MLDHDFQGDGNTLGRTETRSYFINGFGKGTTSEVAEKLDFDLAFGWRSGSPLR